jgi:hypothetical protein
MRSCLARNAGEKAIRHGECRLRNASNLQDLLAALTGPRNNTMQKYRFTAISSRERIAFA